MELWCSQWFIICLTFLCCLFVFHYVFTSSRSRRCLSFWTFLY
jgi:hypothetical protein